MTQNISRFDARMFFLLTIPEIIMTIIEIEKYSSAWKTYTSLSPEYLGNLKKSVIISSTGSSTRIEGSTLSDEEIEKMISKSKIQKLSSRDEQEVNGYLELIKLVFSSYKTIPFSEGTILQFHEMSLHYSEKDQLHKGKYKRDSNTVILVENGIQKGILFNPIPPHFVQGEMIELIEWTRKAFEEKKYSPLLIIGNFIFEYLSIHPFKDGNGRTSRILTNLLLLKAGYEFIPYVSHEQIIEQNKADYYVSLRKSSKKWKTKEDNDISDWIKFFLKVGEIQGQKSQEITQKEDVEVFLSRDQNKIWNCFFNQDNWTRKELSEKTGISPNSINKILQKLVQMKKIQQMGSGRATLYRRL